MKAFLSFISIWLTIVSSNLFSQNVSNINPVNLQGVHSVYLLAGMKINSSSSANTTLMATKSEINAQFSLGYRYWFTNEWAVNASIGFFGAEADVNYSKVESITIIPILFGFNYYPQLLTLGNVGRAFLGVNLGAYMGNATKNSFGFNSFGSGSVSETVLGIEPNAGVDFIVSNWLRIGPSLSYHFISDFKEVIGKKKNYSGPIFSINVGLLL
jgi:outer membrane protein W